MELALYETRQKMQALVPGDFGRPGSPAYEWGNILDRLMINLYNGVPGAVDKARAEARDKRMDPGVVTQVETLLREHREREAARKARGVKEVRFTSKLLPDRETREMYTFLKERFGKINENELTRCVLRYASLGQGGQQWALNRALMDRIKRAGIQLEAFASPFNNYFPRYFSIFKADAPFGSLGSFFTVGMTRLMEMVTRYGLYANPPFTAAALEAMATRVVDIATRVPTAPMVIVTPTWTDAAWYALLLTKFARTEKKDEAYYSLGEEFRPRFATSLWQRACQLT